MKLLVGITLLIVIWGELVRSANIVAIMSTPYYSHQASFRTLWRELARRGHKLHLLTTDIMEDNENITQIDLSETYKIQFEKHKAHEFHKNQLKFLEILPKLRDMLEDVSHYQFTHPDVIKLIRTKTKIDLLLVEGLPMWVVLSTVWKCPFIMLSSMDGVPSLHEVAGNAVHPALYPVMITDYGLNLNFLERLKSTVITVSFSLLNTFYLEPFGNNILQKYVSDTLPDIKYIFRNVSLIFLNINPIFYPARPITPITINLGRGIHIEKSKQLPKDLKDYLDESKHGCIYLSFGSTVKNDYLTPESIETFREAFEELAPIRFLWKYENVSMANKPKNVKIRRWFPQQDILRHPNIMAFITQGGLQSMEETIEAAVPVLGMPFYGDQFNNIKVAVYKKIGIKLDIETLDKQSIKRSITELLTNPIYKKNIEILRAMTKDQPMTPLETAVWWVEYLLRHGSTSHMKSPSADIPLYQYFFIDILAFIVVVTMIIILILYCTIKIFTSLFWKLVYWRRKEKIN